MNAIDSIGPIPLTHRGRLSRLPAAIVAAIATWTRLGRESSQLLAMGGRELRDLSLSRLDALRAAHEPRWPRVKAAFRAVYKEDQS